MISGGTSCPNSSQRYQTHATRPSIASGLLADKSVFRSGMHCSTLTSALAVCFNTLTRMISYSLCMYECLRCLSFTDQAVCQLQVCFFLWISFMMLSSQSSLLISMFVYDIFIIPKGYNPPTCTWRAMGLVPSLSQ